MAQPLRTTERDERRKATGSYVWFMFSLALVLVVFGRVFPDLFAYMHLVGRYAGDAESFLTDLGITIRQRWYLGLGPALLGTIVWLSPLGRASVRRIFYLASLVIGLALISASVAVFLGYFG